MLQKRCIGRAKVEFMMPIWSYVYVGPIWEDPFRSAAAQNEAGWAALRSPDGAPENRSSLVGYRLFNRAVLVVPFKRGIWPRWSKGLGNRSERIGKA